ncbi:hypothetical protein HDU82_000208 [Entophlyctis luteolus]|nr:hypothetical protein HDU82_000208 [Entophlyctis luteolus]
MTASPHLPPRVLRRIGASVRNPRDLFHLACAMPRMLLLSPISHDEPPPDSPSAAATLLRNPSHVSALAIQRKMLGLSGVPTSDSSLPHNCHLHTLVLVHTGLACPVCLEPLFDTSKTSILSAAIHVTSKLKAHDLGCPCCSEVSPTTVRSDPNVIFGLLPAKHANPWVCRNSGSSQSCERLRFCSRLCASPVGTQLNCESEEECGEDGHGCIFCFRDEVGKNAAVIEGDNGMWECMKGLDSSDASSGEEHESDEDAEDSIFGTNPMAMIGSVGIDEAKVHARKRRRMAEGIGADKDEDDDREHKWWSVAAKRCRERGSTRDECICGECDLLSDVSSPE